MSVIGNVTVPLHNERRYHIKVMVAFMGMMELPMELHQGYGRGVSQEDEING